MPFNKHFFKRHTAMPPVVRIIPVANKTTFLGNLRAIFPFKSARQSPTGTSPYSSAHSPNLTTLTTITSHNPSYLCIATIHQSISSTARHRPLFLAPRNARPRYRRDILHRISQGTSQLSVQNYHCPHPVIRPWQDCKQLGGVTGRVTQGFSLGPECALWLVKEPVGSGESLLPSYIQPTLSARSGPGSQLEEHARRVKPRAPDHAEAGGNLSQFPVPEPGGAWLESLWPNIGVEFGPQHVVFWSSPHPSPGDYKREQHGAVERASLRTSFGCGCCPLRAYSGLSAVLLTCHHPREARRAHHQLQMVEQCGAHVAMIPGE